MDWFKKLVQSLPLDSISDLLGNLVVWWSHLVKDVPATELPMYAYVGGSIMVLLLWILVARMLPKPLGGISWVVLFAILFAPGTALGDPSVIAPASISVVYALMVKDIPGALANALPILVVLFVGLFLGFIWQLLRGAIDSSMTKVRQKAEQDKQAQLQLATADYLPESEQQLTPKASTTEAIQAHLQKDKRR